MKILMLTASLSSGGAETHVFELVSALSECGHEIVVASAGGDIAERLKKKNIRHLTLPLNSKRPSRILYSLIRLRRLLKNGNFDIVHVHSRIAALVCRLALKKRDTPTVVSTVHAHFKTSPLLRRLSFWGEGSIAVSEDLKDYLCREYSVPHDEVRVISNAIDTDRFIPQEKTNKKTPPSVLFASRLDSDCSLGAALLCRIAPRLAERYKGIRILIAGGGKYFSKISLLVRRANEAVGYECVKVLGHVKDMPQIFAEADVFVGVSRAALEAMSSGIPVILCGNEGFLGIVDSKNVNEAEKTNFCCRGSELPDAINLYGCVTALLDMTCEERQRLGSYLREYILRRHTLYTLGKETEEFYKDVLKKRPVIVLCGYYGFGNLGDDALLSEAIREVKKRYEGARVTVICHAPKNVAKGFLVRTARRENIPKILNIIKNADRLVLGGGSILQDSTSIRSLYFYTLLIENAARHGVSVELLSNGLGPLKRKSSRKAVAKALSLCEKISLRDTASLSLALSLGIDKKKLELTDDLSSRIPPCDKEELSRLMTENAIDGNKKFFLVSIKGKTRRSLRKIIEGEIKVQIALGLSPIFVVMHNGEDKKISCKLAKKYSAPCLKNLSAKMLLALSSRAELALGNRYHLLYLARRQSTRIIPFGDDPKISGLK